MDSKKNKFVEYFLCMLVGAFGAALVSGIIYVIIIIAPESLCDLICNRDNYLTILSISYQVIFLTTTLLSGLSDKSETIYWERFTEYVLVNPKIIASSVKKIAIRSGEGCLSVKTDKPGYVYRYYKITMRGYDVFQGKVIDINAKGFDAIVLQHEYDHLDGIVYYDRINKTNPVEEIENSVLI